MKNKLTQEFDSIKDDNKYDHKERLISATRDGVTTHYEYNDDGSLKYTEIDYGNGSRSIRRQY